MVQLSLGHRYSPVLIFMICMLVYHIRTKSALHTFCLCVYDCVSLYTYFEQAGYLYG